MSKQYPGGIISKTAPVPSGPYETSTASGIWTLDQQAAYAKLGQWPTAGNVQPDPQFNYVTMLLHGDGTNGAQNNTFLDSSTNNFTITRNGNTTQGSFSPYGSNWSNFFNGSSSITAPDSSAFDYGSGDFTLECWIFPTTTNSGTILTAQTNGGNYGPCNLYFNSGALELYSSSNGSSFDVASGASVGTPTVNQWSHVAVSRSGTSIRCFLNGTVTSTTTSSATLMNATGTFEIASRTGGEFYSGYVSNFRVVKGTAVYTSNFTPSTTPLTAISGTSLLTCADNRFLDDSTNNFTLTAIGTPSVQRFNPFGTATAYSTSVIGGSGYFDGTGDYLSTPNSSSFAFGTGNFTVEFWYRGTDTGGGFGLTTGGSTGYWQLNLSGSTMYWQNDVGVSNLLSVSATPILNDAWNHVAVVRNSTTLTIYFNGVSVTSTSDSSNYSGTGGNFQLGFDSNSNYITGYIADYRIVKGTAVYTANFTPPTAPLTAITNTSLLLSMTNGAIFDNAMMNDLETAGNAQISTSVVKYGTGSLAFDGTGDGLFTRSTPDLAFGTGDFTVELWLNLAANLNAYANVIQMGTTGNAFTIEAQETVNLLTLTNFTSTVYFYSSTALTTGTWIHIAATRASGTLRLFQNGILVGSAANTIDFANTGGVYIGRSGTTQEINGYIDDLRITKGYARYTANFTPPTAAFPNTGPN